MKVIRSISRLQAELKKERGKGKKIGLVATMGALHAGHLSLVRVAKRECPVTIVSIFVNPTQFAPKEDFGKYPRPLRKDLSLLRKEKVDLVFVPDSRAMYPEGFSTFVNVEGLSRLLCGRDRPGHFRGVATAVAKLFNIACPDKAYFGAKDAQQALIIRRMCRDLNFTTKIKVLPTVREKDGLALSSRNAYLSKGERADAPVIFKALGLARALIRHGAFDTNAVIRRMRELIKKKKSAKIDYIAIVGTEDLLPLKKIRPDCLIALAVRIGRTRLIDNILIKARRGSLNRSSSLRGAVGDEAIPKT